MKLPFLTQEESGTSRSMSDLLMQVVLPGLLVVYLVRTEPDYLSSFIEDESLLATGEVLFLSIHLLFTYLVLPLTWLFDAVEFLARKSHPKSAIRLLGRFGATTLPWMLFVAIVLRIVATV